jgi:hypothetical protein
MCRQFFRSILLWSEGQVGAREVLFKMRDIGVCLYTDRKYSGE